MFHLNKITKLVGTIILGGALLITPAQAVEVNQNASITQIKEDIQQQMEVLQQQMEALEALESKTEINKVKPIDNISNKNKGGIVLAMLILPILATYYIFYIFMKINDIIVEFPLLVHCLVGIIISIFLCIFI